MNVVVLTNTVKLRWSHISVGSFHWNTADKPRRRIVYWPDSSSLLVLEFSHYYTGETINKPASSHLASAVMTLEAWTAAPLWYKIWFVPTLVLCCLCFIFILPPAPIPQGQGCGCRLKIMCRELRGFSDEDVPWSSGFHLCIICPVSRTFRIRQTC